MAPKGKATDKNAGKDKGKGRGKGDAAEEGKGAGGKVKGAQTINVRHILVRSLSICGGKGMRGGG